MTDEALKRAYRQLTAGNNAAEADVLAALASGDVKDTERDAHLAMLVDSAQNADVLRVIRALDVDAKELSADVQRLRRPVAPAKRSSPPLRWLAVAASLALAGVIGLALRSPVSPVQPSVGPVQADAIDPAGPSEGDASMIMMASFENGVSSSTRPSIFIGDFDS